MTISHSIKSLAVAAMALTAAISSQGRADELTPGMQACLTKVVVGAIQSMPPRLHNDAEYEDARITASVKGMIRAINTDCDVRPSEAKAVHDFVANLIITTPID